MKAVILAGGLGARLKPFTEVIPKPLLPIGEKSLLEVQISRLKKHGFDEIYLATNYKSDYIQSFFADGSRLGVKLTVNKEKKPLGTCGPIRLLSDKLDQPFLVINGDILTTMDFSKLYDFALRIDSDFVVATKEIITPFEFGNVNSEGDYLTSIEEKPDLKLEIIAGIYVLKPSVIDLIPEDEYFGMDMLIKKMFKAKLPVAKYLISEYWLDIGNINDYKIAHEAYLDHFKDQTS
ncbi:MAG: sugar phosphate nucleotidyltransferase [Nitrospinales bacterium]